MIDIKPSTILVDSKGNRYFFYYKDSSIYYRVVSVAGDIKDTILVSQIYGDYAVTIDTDDIIYLACNSRYKGILLYIYTNNEWKFEPVLNLHNSSNTSIMDIIASDSSIHIFFSKKLPISNMYNVYHIHKSLKDQAPYAEYSWIKNSLSEIYAYNYTIENSYSILPLKGGIIHYASVWHDGTHYFINYYCYDDSIKSWIHKSLNISNKNQIFIKLIHHNRKINLLCFSADREANNIHHFIIKSSGAGEIDFKEVNSSRINTNGTIPLFYSDDETLILAWIKDNVFHQYTLDDLSGNWNKTIDLPLTAETNINAVKIIRNQGSVSITRGYFLLDKNYNISMPVGHSSGNARGNMLRAKPLIYSSYEMNEYLRQILDEIKNLTDNIIHINKRIDNLESVAFVQKAAEGTPKELLRARQGTAANVAYEPVTLKKTNFREKFMSNTKIPNYDSLVLQQENVTTFVGQPEENKTNGDYPAEIKADGETAENEQQADVFPDPKPLDESEIDNSLLKTEENPT